MREWNINGLEILEKEFDYDLHMFAVWRGENLLGNIYPDSIETMENMIKELDKGISPIKACWEDGCGNTL